MGRNKKLSAKNRADKLVSFWQEPYTKKFVVGVQGTDHWYQFSEDQERQAKAKFQELVSSYID